MSILAKQSLTSGLIFFIAAEAALLGLSAVLAIAWRMYRPSAVVGPARLAPGRPAWPLAIGLGIALFCFFSVQVLFAAVKTARNPGAGAAAVTLENFTAGDWTFLVTVPGIVGLSVLVIADALIGGAGLIGELGAGIRKIPRGVCVGLLCALIIIPWVYLLDQLTEYVYIRLHFIHPREHPLLKQMGISPNRSIRWALILSAVAIAPLWEEFLFRVHLQTLLKKLLVMLSTPLRLAPVYIAARPQGFPLDVPPPLPSLSVAAQAVAPVAVAVLPEPVKPAVWQTWVSIVITSLLFMSVHDKWMWPPIFLLALGLGYCYERTGNAWVNVTLHATFNSISTVIYLAQLAK